MPPRKHALSSVDSDSATKGDREVKRKKTAHHRTRWNKAVQDILNLLSPTTNEALAKFNKREKKKNRYGVVPINICRVQRTLAELRNAKDVKSLEAKLQEIDSYLEEYQDAFSDYIVEHGAEWYVQRYLDEVIYPITVARKSLPGMSSLLDELLRKLNVTIHRS